jgi:hypothetical protein
VLKKLTLVFIDPADGSGIDRTDALDLGLYEIEFVENQDGAPKIGAKL